MQSRITTLLSFDFSEEFRTYNHLYFVETKLDDYVLIQLFNQAFEYLEQDMAKYARTLAVGVDYNCFGLEYTATKSSCVKSIELTRSLVLSATSLQTNGGCSPLTQLT